MGWGGWKCDAAKWACKNWNLGCGYANSATNIHSVVAGGFDNVATGANSTISGGDGNRATGANSTISGGEANCAGGDNSWAGGAIAQVRPGNEAGDGTCVTNSADPNGDEGTFVWADAVGGAFISTGPNQFLVSAAGGMAINTNTPAASTSTRRSR